MDQFLAQLAQVWRPHAGQAIVLASAPPVFVLSCGRRWGKTDAAAALAAHAFLRPGTPRVLLLAPTLVQASWLFDRAIEFITAVGGPDPPPRPRRTPHPRLDWRGATLQARSGHVANRLRGDGADLIIVDEAAFLPETLVTEVALPMLASTNGRLVLLSSPNGTNWFWRLFRRGQTEPGAVQSYRAPSWEAPHVSREFLTLQQSLISDRAFRTEYGAEFLDAATSVFRPEVIEACLVPEVSPSSGAPIAIGIDWARYHDWTAVAVLSGWRPEANLLALERFQQQPWPQLVATAANVIRRWPGARVRCDATGVGDPALDLVREACPTHAVDGLVLTAEIKQRLVEGLVWSFEQRAIRLVPHADLQAELAAYTATPRPHGPPRLAARGRDHDDLVTALALARDALPDRYAPTLRLGPARNFSVSRRPASPCSMRFRIFHRPRPSAPRETAPALTLPIRRALAAPGTFPGAGALPPGTYDDLQRDAMVQTALTIKRLAVLAAPAEVVAPDLSEDARRRTEFVQRAFDRMEGAATAILDQALDALAYGWSIQERVLHRTPEGISLRAMRPKDPRDFGLEFDAFGRLDGLTLQLPGEAIRRLDPSRFVIYRYRAGYGRPKGRSDLEAVLPHVQAKRALQAAWRLHLERFASPTVTGKFPRTLAETEQSALLDALGRLHENTAVLFPNEVEVGLLGSSRDASTTFLDAIEHHNREIARAILGQTLTTDEGRRVGSLALGRVHLQVLLLQVAALRQELADVVMTEQVIRPLVELNFGPGPIPRWQFRPAPVEAFASGQL